MDKTTWLIYHDAGLYKAKEFTNSYDAQEWAKENNIEMIDIAESVDDVD